MKFDKIVVMNTFKGSVNDVTGVITLQRQGCSQTLNAGNDLFFVELSQHYTGKGWVFSVSYGSNKAWGYILGGQCYYRCATCFDSVDTAKKEALIQVNNLLKKARVGVEYKFSDFVQAYMYDFGITYDYCNDDKIISPFYFSEGVIFGSGAREIAKWTGLKGDEVEIITTVNSEVKAVKEAFEKGYHDCNFKQGANRCQRRLAWLAGEYLKTEVVNQVGKIECFILNNKMERF